jgi:hypothetical protein
MEEFTGTVCGKRKHNSLFELKKDLMVKYVCKLSTFAELNSVTTVEST